MKLRGINTTLLLIFAGLIAAGGLAAAIISHQYWNLVWAVLIAAWLVIFIHTAVSGYPKIWRKLINRLNIAKDAQVLELSLGRLDNLLAVAHSLQQPGKVTGAGQWKGGLQKAQAKVNAAGIADRVSLADTNVFNMTFTDRRFDYVLVDLAFHDITPAIERGRALQEASRVLKPTGKIVIADFAHIAEYRQILTNLGFNDVQAVTAGVNGWWGGPWAATQMVVAQRR